MPTFTELLNLSVRASWLVLAVIGLRLVLKKAPKSFHCALWALVAIRLLCPFSIESELSLLPSREIVPESYLVQEPGDLNFTEPVKLQIITNPAYDTAVSIDTEATVDRIQTWDLLASVLWLGGVGAMAIYAACSYLSLRLRVRMAGWLRENIYECDEIASPFILGLLRPRIYLPSGLDEITKSHVLAHENAHLKRLDHLWKPLGFALLTIHWFNPILWLAYVLLCRDIELACDEKVIRRLDKPGIRAYSEALVHCSVSHRSIAMCPLAFGEVGVKGRIRTMLHYKKPAFWMLVLAALCTAILTVCLLTDPETPQSLSSPTEPTKPDITQTAIVPGAYVLNHRDPGAPYLLLYEDDRFTFFLPPEGTVSGNWQVAPDGAVTLRADAEGLWRFYPDYHGQLRFDSAGSDPVTVQKAGAELYLVDGSAFNLISSSGGEYAMSLYDLAPGQTAKSTQTVTLEEGGTVSYVANYVSSLATLEIFLEDTAGNRTFFQTAEGGYREGNFTNLPAGTYHICVTNTGSCRVDGGQIGYAPSDHSCEINYYVPTQESNKTFTTPLDQAIRNAICDYYRSDAAPDLICVSAYKTMDQTELCIDGDPAPGMITTVYLMARYQEYSVSQGKLVLQYDRCVPTILTFEGDSPNYRLTEYWMPRSGTHYEEDIASRFTWKARDHLTWAGDSTRNNLARKCETYAQMRLDAGDLANLSAPVQNAVDVRTVYTLEADGLHGPRFQLEPDGTFFFSENPLISYMGYGSYTMTGDQIVMATEDGNFTWVFRITDGILLYDAKQSSPVRWYPDLKNAQILPDGARFIGSTTYGTESESRP